MRIVPEPLEPMAGGVILKTVCDKCHRRGHKAHGNRGNQACPFDQCEGYMNCGNLAKHKEYKQSIVEAKKEVSTIEKEMKCNQEKITNLQAFLQQNTTNFVKMVKPRLQFAFPNRYFGKDGNQTLQKDLRYTKIASNGKIPSKLSAMTAKDFEELINNGRNMVSSKFNIKSTEDSVSGLSVSTSPLTCTCSTNLTSTPIMATNTSQVMPTHGNMACYNPMYQVWPGMYPYNYYQDHAGYNSYASTGMWFVGSPSTSVPATCTVSSPPQQPSLQGHDIFPPLPLDPPKTPRRPSPDSE